MRFVFWYVLFLFLHSQFLFSKQITPEYFHECKQSQSQIEPKIIFSNPPFYPRTALERGIEASVLLEFAVNRFGNVENPKVIWSNNTGTTIYEGFSESAIKSALELKYEPAKNLLGEPIRTETVKLFSTFRVEGHEALLDINDKDFEKYLSRAKSKSVGRSKRKLNKLVEDIQVKLDNPDLSNIGRASYLYLKGIVLMKLETDKDMIHKVFLESKNLQNKEYYELDEKKYRNVTSEKLSYFLGVLLADRYFEQKEWNKVETEVKELLGIFPQRVMQERFYKPLLQLGIASYSSQNWCNSYYSFNAAMKIAEKKGLDFPEPLIEAMELSASYLN